MSGGQRKVWSRSLARPAAAVPRPRFPLRVEPLEIRAVLTQVAVGGTIAEGADVPDVLVAARELGEFAGVVSLGVDGQIGNGSAAGADVDWYRFSLAAPGRVSLRSASAVLTLYNDNPYNFGDPYTLLGRRQLGQSSPDPLGEGLVLAQALPAGTYFLAVSGAGNLSFHPLLAASGYPGSTGPYHVDLSAEPVAPTAGPGLLSSSPRGNEVLARSPFALRLVFSTDLDTATIQLGDNVVLSRSGGPRFRDRGSEVVLLAGLNYSTTTHELELFSATPLSPGSYQLRVSGVADARIAPVQGVGGIPLGMDATHPNGRDYFVTFQVNGVEGEVGRRRADDTPATAHELGLLRDGDRVSVASAIGDDPASPAGFDPSDVDMYHFRVVGPGRGALVSEVFARRIGSPLNPALTLFRRDPVSRRLVFVTSNDNTANSTPTVDNSSVPLYSDAVVFAGLMAGDYYLAVSSSGNLVDPAQGLTPGMNGVFDPLRTHSGSAGESVGDYVLHLALTHDADAPEVVSTSLADGQRLAAPPTRFTVRFSEPMNLQELAFRAFELAGTGSLGSVRIEGTGGTFYPRLESYDALTGEATFLLLDALPNGEYQLRLAGPLGLADLAGNPLVGNDPVSGDHRIAFTVDAAPRGSPNDPLLWQFTELTGTADLGTLFPLELQQGVHLTRTFDSATPTPFTDQYAFTVLQHQHYLFLPDAVGLSDAVTLRLLTETGEVVPISTQGSGHGLLAILPAGRYILEVSGPSDPAGYHLLCLLGGTSDNAPPLTVGPIPVIQPRLAMNPGLLLRFSSPIVPPDEMARRMLEPIVPTASLSQDPPKSVPVLRDLPPAPGRSLLDAMPLFMPNDLLGLTAPAMGGVGVVAGERAAAATGPGGAFSGGPPLRSPQFAGTPVGAAGEDLRAAAPPSARAAEAAPGAAAEPLPPILRTVRLQEVTSDEQTEGAAGSPLIAAEAEASAEAPQVVSAAADSPRKTVDCLDWLFSLSVVLVAGLAAGLRGRAPFAVFHRSLSGPSDRQPSPRFPVEGGGR